jgi:hypothetical protein
MDKEKIENKLSDDLKIIAFREHSKASEKYIDVEIYSEGEFVWYGSIPYYYRRTGLFIENEVDLVDYLKEIKKFFTKESLSNFVNTETKHWDEELFGKKTTKAFFDKLLNMKWNSVKKDFPTNPNWARRIQDIKELGYTLATHTNMEIKGSSLKGTHILLLPIPKGGGTGYEIMSESFKKKAIKALSSINAFELSNANKHGLIPDHKFPEIRWDNKTKEENETLTDDEIKEKFQLLDNQRNLQKREICRKCFQTNIRGIIFGITYFYEGNREWSKTIPKVGKDAEKGCKGCAWYDIQKWRESLNELLSKEAYHEVW